MPTLPASPSIAFALLACVIASLPVVFNPVVVEDVLTPEEVEDVVEEPVRALCTLPAGTSAISFTSSVPRLSPNLLPRLCIKIVVGPLNCRNNLSPHIPRLAHVLME
jgi:hypothetical protein